MAIIKTINKLALGSCNAVTLANLVADNDILHVTARAKRILAVISPELADKLAKLIDDGKVEPDGR